MLYVCTQLDEAEQNLLMILSNSDDYWIENDQVNHQKKKNVLRHQYFSIDLFLRINQVITSLLPSITQSNMLREKLNSLKQTKDRMNTQRAGFLPAARLATRVHDVLSRLCSVSGRLHLSLERFALILVTCSEDVDEDEAEATFSNNRKLAARMYRKLKLNFDSDQRIIATILLCVSVACDDGVCQESMYQDLHYNLTSNHHGQ